MKRPALIRSSRLVPGHELDVAVKVDRNIIVRRKSLMQQKLIFVATMLAFAPLASAAPTGGRVTSGSGSVNQSGATTIISQSSQNLSLNWDSFNVNSNETVNFVQPSASSIAVNRILDSNGSQILGNLNANGQVYLINPNGILFGQGAQVNVGGLIASTLDISDASLNSDARIFSGHGSGSITNQGNITAADGGYVALLGNTVSNRGTINANLGSVALGAGSAATLTFAGNSLVKMQIDQSTLDNLAENGGLIHADGGTVLMSAGAKDALLASVVNNTGIIEAHTVQNQNGTIILLGGMAAGTTNVGGTLDASAPNGGNGGYIETSAAHVNVAGDAQITTAATNGLTGNWLIDPVDFIIADSGGNMASTALSNSLASSDVTIQSTSGTISGNGDIIVNGAVSWSNASTLTLSAQNDININANINASGGAKLALQYGQATPTGGTSTYTLGNGAQINLPAGPNFSTQLGSSPVKNYTVITALGTEADATTATATLQGMAAPGNLTGNYVLGANIDASSTATWNTDGAATPTYAGFTPIGDATNNFTGTFDGLGHAISNLTINLPATDNVGLFGYAGAASVIRNVQVGGTVTGATNVGILVGSNLGTVSYSYASGTVNGTSAVGGLAGSNAGTITSSYSSSNVSGSGSGFGGLAGSNAGTVSSSYATGKVIDTGTSSNLGGLVGINAGTVSSSYETGSVTSSTGSNIGGLVGNNVGTVSSSYETGSVTSSTGSNIGGLVGSNSGTVSSSYWDTSTNPSSSYVSVGIGGGTTTGATGNADMMLQGNFGGFDFSNDWIIYDGYTIPLLRTFLVPLTVTANNYSVIYTGLTVGLNGVSYSTTPDTSNLLGTVSYGGDAVGAVNVKLDSNNKITSYTITPGGLYSTQQQGGYAIIYVSGKLTINPASLTVTGTTVSNKVYDGTTDATVGTAGTLKGVLGNDLANLVLTQSATFFSANAGTAVNANVTSNLGGSAAGNYTLAPTGVATADITPLGITESGATVSDKVYDGTTDATLTGGTLTGVLNSDNVSLVQIGSYATANAGQGISVDVTDSLGGTAAGNYTLTTPTSYTLPGNISQRSVTVTGTAVGNKVYDGGTTASVTGGSLNNVISADQGNLILNQSGVFASSNVANGISVTETDSLSDNSNGAVAGNYTLSTPTNQMQANITPATLIYTGSKPTILNLSPGQAPSGLTGTVSGFVGSDTLTNSTTGTVAWSTTATVASGPGQYSIDGSGLTANNGNYVFTQAIGNATALTLTRQGGGSAPPPPPQIQPSLLPVAQITASQLESNVLSDQSANQPDDISVSSTITTVPGSETVMENKASPSARSNETNNWTVGEGGPVLHIINAGMMIPGAITGDSKRAIE